MPLSLAESLASEWCGVKVGFPSATTAGMSFPAGIPTDGISTPMQAAPPALAAIKVCHPECCMTMLHHGYNQGCDIGW